jgi:hypothetical protein
VPAAKNEASLGSNNIMVSRPVAVVVAMLSLCAWADRATAQEPIEPSLFAKMTAPSGTESLLPGPVSPTFRGAILPSLYAGLIGLQAFDGYSTNHGLKNGASESNAALEALTRHPAAVWAVKGATAFASIYVAECLWRQHRRGQAIVLMVVSTGIMAAVAANNALVIRRER